MVKVNADEFARKWGKRLKGSTEEIRKGVERVQEAPSKKAIAKKDKMLKKLTEAIENGRWERGLEKVSLDDWQNAMVKKGLNRISAGVDEAEGKMADFGEKLLTHIESGQNKIKDMPDLTLEDNIQRMTEFIRHMSKFKYK